jgi:hypothetical protein
VMVGLGCGNGFGAPGEAAVVSVQSSAPSGMRA